MLALRGLPPHNLAFQALLTSIDCPSTLALLDHHFLDHSYVSPEHTLTDLDLVLFKALGDGVADDKGAGLVGLQRWKRQISSRLGAGGGGLQGLGGKQVTLDQVLETISKDKPSKIKVNKTCDNVSVFSWLPVFNIKSRSMTASPFSELWCWTQFEKLFPKSCFNRSPFYSQQPSLLKRWEASAALLVTSN